MTQTQQQTRDGRLEAAVPTLNWLSVSVEDADLIIGAVGSYRRHCGSNAVAAADADLLGEAMWLVRQLLRIDHPRDCHGDCGHCVGCRARAVLAQATA